MDEQKPQTYYPSARVRFIVRFEDFGAADLPPAPKTPPQLRRNDAKKGDELRVVMSNGAQVLCGPGDDPNKVGGPQTARGSSDGRTHVIDGVIPSNASHQRNGARTADTLSVTVFFGDFPFDPRAMRSVAVEYFFGCVNEEDYRRGLNGQLRAASESESATLPRNVIPDTFVDANGAVRSNLRFQGWVDEWENEWDDEAGPTVTFQCTDNTRLFLGQDAPPKLAVDSNKPIDEAVAGYLARFPQFRGLRVEYRPGGDRSKIPKLKEALSKAAYNPKLGPPSQPGGGAGSQKVKVWDYLTEVAGMIGHIVRVDGDTVVIQRARTLYAGRASGNPGDPFAQSGGRSLDDGTVLPRRLMLYGRNVKSLRWRRQYTENVPSNIEIRCYDVRNKRTVVARFPEKGDRLTRPAPGDANDQTWHVREVVGVFEKKQLKRFAQSIYEQQSRGEIQVSLETKCLASYGGGNADPDLLDLDAGDSIDLAVVRDQGTQHTTAGDIEEQRAEGVEPFLRALGYQPELAAAAAVAARGMAMQNTWRVKTTAVTWDKEEGASVKIECVNYIELRADKDVDDEDQLGAAAGGASAAVGVPGAGR